MIYKISINEIIEERQRVANMIYYYWSLEGMSEEVQTKLLNETDMFYAEKLLSDKYPEITNEDEIQIIR